MNDSTDFAERWIDMIEDVMMDATTPEKIERQIHQVQANRTELVERISKTVDKDGRIEVLKGLFFNRISTTQQSRYGVAKPCFCVKIDLFIAQYVACSCNVKTKSTNLPNSICL